MASALCVYPVRRAQVSGLMMSLMETFSPSYLQPLPLRGLYMRACLNLVNNYRCGGGVAQSRECVCIAG